MDTETVSKEDTRKAVGTARWSCTGVGNPSQRRTKQAKDTLLHLSELGDDFHLRNHMVSGEEGCPGRLWNSRMLDNHTWDFVNIHGHERCLNFPNGVSILSILSLISGLPFSSSFSRQPSILASTVHKKTILFYFPMTNQNIHEKNKWRQHQDANNSVEAEKKEEKSTAFLWRK